MTGLDFSNLPLQRDHSPWLKVVMCQKEVHAAQLSF